MYKYQIEILNELEKTFNILETKTEDRMSFKIGFMRDSILNLQGTRYIERSGDLYIRLNYDTRFKFNHDYETEYYSISKDAYLSIRQNIFLELNKFIEKIFKNEQEKRVFGFKLKKELEALNKSLEQ